MNYGLHLLHGTYPRLIVFSLKMYLLVEHEPEIQQTAYGVFSDLIRVLSNMNC